jgi:hypothetical protein
VRLQNVGDAVREDAGLPRAGAGHDQERRPAVLNRACLGLVQAGEHVEGGGPVQGRRRQRHQTGATPSGREAAAAPNGDRLVPRLRGVGFEKKVLDVHGPSTLEQASDIFAPRRHTLPTHRHPHPHITSPQGLQRQ